jgi:predicted metallopeptidase
MAALYYPAPEVETLSKDIITKYHEHLKDTRIEYVFTDKVPKQGNKEIWAYVRKISSLNAYLASEAVDQNNVQTTPFFVMVVTEPIWKELSNAKREALIDHELLHCGVEIDDEGTAKLKLLPHDLEEFTAIVQRHGLWREDVKRFVETAK